MLDDETEPSIFFKYDYNLSSTSSSMFCDEEINYLARRTSFSLRNISSTPYATRVRDIFNKSKNSADIHTNIDKSIVKSNNSDSAENKVKKYINEIKHQQEDDAKRKQIEEENLKLEDERKYLEEVHGIEQEALDCGNISIVPVDQYKELFEQHKKALSVIESQRIEILKMKSSFNKSAQKDGLLEGLFRANLIDGNNINTPRRSVVGLDSTCVTEDIYQYVSEEKTSMSDFVTRRNVTTAEYDPFMVNSQNESMCVSFHSDAPLLISRHKYRYKNVSHKYRRPSKVLKLFTCCQLFKNNSKVKPHDLPQVVITSPTVPNSDSGNQSYKTNFGSVSSANKGKTEKEQLLEQIIACTDELTSNIEAFRRVAQEYVQK